MVNDDINVATNINNYNIAIATKLSELDDNSDIDGGSP